MNDRDPNEEVYNEKFTSGAYLISIDTDTENLFSYIYKTNEDRPDASSTLDYDEYTQTHVIRLEKTPLGGTGKCEKLSYDIQLESGEKPADMYLSVSQPKYFDAWHEMEFTRNSIDQDRRVANLVIDRSYDKLYELFCGFMNGKTYYGRSSYIDNGTLIIVMAQSAPFPQ